MVLAVKVDPVRPNLKAMIAHRNVGDEVSTPTAHLDRATLERLCDAFPEPMALVCSAETRIIYCNQTFMDLCGLRPHAAKRLITSNVLLTDILRIDNGQQLIDLIRKSALLEQTMGAESLLRRKQNLPGNDLVLTVVAIPFDTYEHRGPVVLINLRNITAEHRVQNKYQRLLRVERRHAEDLEKKIRERTRELAETQEELLHATRLAAIGEVAGSAAHEVLNPLTAVSANLDYLKSSLKTELEILSEMQTIVHAMPQLEAKSECTTLPPLTEEWSQNIEQRRRIINIVCSASRRIERIVQSMLGMSRSEAEPEKLDLSHVFREVRDLMAYTFERAGVMLSITDNTSPDVRVYVDRGEILQVLTNLLRNACHAAQNAHGRHGGAVRMTLDVFAQTARICVEDNGVGVPETLSARIFESGFTTKPKGEGSGLGLPISRRPHSTKRGRFDS